MTLTDYLSSNGWLISPEWTDRIHCQLGTLRFRQCEPYSRFYQLSKVTDNKAKLIVWEMDFNNVPEPLIIAAIQAALA